MAQGTTNRAPLVEKKSEPFLSWASFFNAFYGLFFDGHGKNISWLCETFYSACQIKSAYTKADLPI